MKKVLAGTVFAAAMAVGTMASASVPGDQLVLGGIEFGASSWYVEQVYGTPTESETKQAPWLGGTISEYEYGDSFELLFVNDYVRRASVDRHNGIKMKAGIEVGSTLAEVKAAYGEPDKVRHDHYIYYSEDSQDVGIDIEIENDKVREIEVGFLG